MRGMKLRKKLLVTSIALGLTACGGGDDPGEPLVDDNFGLDEAAAYAGNYAESQAAESDAKFDQTLPATFDLIATQSPIKSQGSRGVCSIFGTTALMEHLYITEGTLTDPDFSEQFLQWSAKFEVGSFRNSGGSNSRSNLQALSRFGSVEETVWPYESRGWGTSDDEACTGDDRPTRCYTNGEPPATALEARRWFLPRGRWLNNSVESIKGHMFNTNTAVQAGGDFYYQSWGHGGSEIPRYSGYRRHGYVTTPNAEDVRSSNTHRAGHSFLLVGWSDELEVQRIDAEGNLAVDDQGEPIMDVGFFLFKNSWGDGWAQDNPHGAGYGWISYEYVERYLSTYVSGVPEVTLTEVCGDQIDNDNDTFFDCADSDCRDDRACIDPVDTDTNSTPVDIPDNDSNGASSVIEVAEAGTISGLSVAVNIEHSYRGDLAVFLEKDGQMVALIENQGGGEDNIEAIFDVSEFDGEEAAGTWTLRVVDSAAQDTGRIVEWSLDITRCAGGDCDSTPDGFSATNDTLAVIPDNDSAGISREIEVTEGHAITAARVAVNINHMFPGDLRIVLIKDGTEVELINQPDVDSEAYMQTFTVSNFNGQDSAGTWTLRVEDNAANDEGTLNAWTLDLTY